MIQGAIFDCDGTLFDSMYLYQNFVTRYLTGRGLIPANGIEDTVRYMSMWEAAEYVRSVYSLQETADEIIADCNRMLECAYFHEILLRPGVAAVLAKLYEHGVPMCIATATDRYLVEGALRRVGIDHYFDAITTCGEAGAGKEQPNVFLQALELLGTPLAATWVFEDARHAVVTAKKCGFPVCAVWDADEEDHAAQIEKQSDIYLKSFTDLSVERLFA